MRCDVLMLTGAELVRAERGKHGRNVLEVDRLLGFVGITAIGKQRNETSG
jgi:hypothetical protein